MRGLRKELFWLSVVVIPLGLAAVAFGGGEGGANRFYLFAAVDKVGEIDVRVHGTPDNAAKPAKVVAQMSVRKLYDGARSYYEEEMNARASATPIAKQFPDQDTVGGVLLAGNVALLSGEDPIRIAKELGIDPSALDVSFVRPLSPDRTTALASLIAANLNFHADSPSGARMHDAYLKSLIAVNIRLPCP